MTTGSILLELTIIFAVAVATVTVLHRIGAPTIAGFIFAGALIGPKSLGLISHTHHVEVLAEVGVILLMFGIGIELSLSRIKRLWKPVLLGGMLQVGLTAGAAILICLQLGIPLNTAIFVGFLTAVSSTAIVLSSLEQHGETDSIHGRLTLGILVFQDLSVIPMILAVPLLAGTSGSSGAVAITTLKAIGVLVAVLVLSRFIVPRLLGLVAQTRQRDLFVLAVFLICISTAWSLSLMGISLALGAFLAGLVVSDSEYSHQALSEMIPLKEVLTSLFFISVGMMFDPRIFPAHPWEIFAILAAILVGKLLIVTLTGVVLRLPLRFAVLAGVSLAQVGEFFFVMLHAANGTSLLDPSLASVLSAAVILSMFITPIFIRLGPHVAAGAGRMVSFTKLMGIREAAEVSSESDTLKSHVILSGWGVTGQSLAAALKKEGIPYLIVDLNPDNVGNALKAGEPIVFGDVSSADVLKHLHIHDAAALVIAINQHRIEKKAVAVARRSAPNLRIIVRTRFITDVPELLDAGANAVIPAELEAAVSLVKDTLKMRGVPDEKIRMYAKELRRAQTAAGQCRITYPAPPDGPSTPALPPDEVPSRRRNR